jgi:hypothetical protein
MGLQRPEVFGETPNTAGGTPALPGNTNMPRLCPTERGLSQAAAHPHAGARAKSFTIHTFRTRCELRQLALRLQKARVSDFAEVCQASPSARFFKRTADGTVREFRVFRSVCGQGGQERQNG